MFRIYCVVFLLLALPLPSRAQSNAYAVDHEARTLFEAGRAAYEAHQYEAALENFERAFELSRRFQLQYNIGLVQDRLRHDEQAIEAFESYLRAVPNGERADEVEARLKALKASLASRGGSAAPAQMPAETAQQPDRDSSRVRKRRIWIAVASILAVGAGVTVGLLAASGDDSPEPRPEPNTGIRVEALTW